MESWKKLFKEGNTVSGVLRKDIKVLDWVFKEGNNIPQGSLDDLITNLDGKTIQTIFEDGQGRLVTLTESTGATRTVVTLEKTVTGEVKSFKYTQAYNKAGQPGMPPISTNGLAPDFSGNPNWLYPAMGNQKNIVKVKLSGKRNGTDGDFHRANQQAGFSGTTPPDGYTWHHLDNYDPSTGESTMQLVKRAIHESTLPHTGSVKQIENYTGIKYKD